MSDKGIYDERNQLNDLTGKEWIRLTKSFLFSERSAADKAAFGHPAPFLIKDIEKMISMFTKKGMTVLDPFVGSGTTIIASDNLQRSSIGIDLSYEYSELAKERFDELGINMDNQHRYIVGDSLIELEYIDDVDYIISSPPYHNILRNKNTGIRSNNSDKGFRNGSRQGVEYYSEMEEDLGNQETYEEFLVLLQRVMHKAFDKLNNNKYCSLILSDFTVDKKEVCVQGDIVRIMSEIGFDFVGTIALLQDSKPLYPFGYPYAFIINHMHQNIINFRKRV